MHATTSDAATLSPAGWDRWSWLLGCLAVALQLVLVWAVDVFPTVDGPAHAHLAHALYESLRGDPFYGGLVELNPVLNPNLAAQGALLALMAVAPPLLAEKLWVSVYFGFFALAGAYALTGINARALCLLPVLVLCSLSLPLAFGFYNFSLSGVVLLTWFGYWWRHRQQCNLRVVLAHLALATLAYATHIFALVSTIFAIAVAGTAAIAMDLHASSAHPAGQRLWKSFRTHAVPPLLGSLLALAAAATFLLGSFGAQTASGAASLGSSDVAERFRAFLAGTSLAPYDNVEILAASVLAPVLLAFGLISLRKRGALRRSLPLGVCFAAFLALYLVMPPQWVVRWMPARFQPLVFVMLVLWVAALVPASLPRRHWLLIAAASLALLAFSVHLRLPVFQRLDAYYREMASVGQHIERGSSLVSIRMTNNLAGVPFPARLDVLIQAGSRIASERHAVDLKNFQAQSPDHPIQFKPGIGAIAAFGGDAPLISLAPTLDLMAYERSTGQRIDYILLYGIRRAPMSRKGLDNLDRQLASDYDEVATSAPLGLATLYRRRHDH